MEIIEERNKIMKEFYNLLGVYNEHASVGPKDGPVEPGRWGLVVVKHGPHKNKIGYYDDDAERNGYGIVYFDIPLISGYYSIALKRLRPATEQEIKYYLTRLNDMIYDA